MPKLSVTDQLKSLRDDIRDYHRQTRSTGMTVDLIEHKLKAVATDINDLQKNVGGIKFEVKSLNKRFDKLEIKLFEWKSELFSKIDQGCITRWKNQTEEHAAIEFRLEGHQKEIDKIKSVVFNQ